MDINTHFSKHGCSFSVDAGLASPRIISIAVTVITVTAAGTIILITVFLRGVALARMRMRMRLRLRLWAVPVCLGGELVKLAHPVAEKGQDLCFDLG